ncbi:hypothetical protein ACFWP5_24280 [Streptomyces sp. NPDC058469]|uniref:hypothetical protein n=1 Tax=Streptomyces sp. NPDC058469 TaxID=3346514 RepID=UPI00364F2913
MIHTTPRTSVVRTAMGRCVASTSASRTIASALAMSTPTSRTITPMIASTSPERPNESFIQSAASLNRTQSKTRSNGRARVS